MTLLKPLCLALSLSAFAAAGYAADSSKTSKSSAQRDQFSQMDKNHDGKVSRSEWNAAHKSASSGSSASHAGMHRSKTSSSSK
jgi:Ca2+-binding EF-hand superfamily protein